MADSASQTAPAPLTLATGSATFGLVTVAIIIWGLLCGLALHIEASYVGLIFIWYWGGEQKTDFKRLPEAFGSALFGIILAWQFHYLSVRFGTPGLIIGLVIILTAVFSLIMGWGAKVINNCAMLFLLIFTIPSLVPSVNFLDLIASLVAAAIYFPTLIYVAMRFAGNKAAAVEPSQAVS